MAARLLVNKLAVRLVILIAVISLLAIGTAAQKDSSNSAKHSNAPSDNSPVVLEKQSSTTAGTPEPANDPATSSSTTTTITPGTTVNTSNTGGEVRVTVNGQDVAVPDNGSSQQVISTPNSTSVVNVTSTGTATNQSTSVQSSTISNGTDQVTKVEHNVSP